MNNSFAPQTTYAFKLKCPKCQKKVKKLLSRLNGVHSIKVEGDAGRVTMKSSVDLNTLAAAIGEVMEGQKYSCDGLTPPPPPPPPNEQENKNHMPHESNTATGPSGCIQVESMPHCGELVLNYSGPYHTHDSYQYQQFAMPPYHAYYHHYPPPPYYGYGYQVMQPHQMPPLAKVNNHMADLSCDYSSKCRMM
ncbi:hypothetical protein TanjilG_24612 [Lupinus angustifolius]|uniref:HMA domain-containing protein n=2 Tax=Lupinus angustifolius TaxID=3871 RepID=A0A4P1RKG2_LUPAN|nr:hypothetical protein TanjilG_24612 [Lupinus angustifolius]